jgi:hypothetical protein
MSKLSGGEIDSEKMKKKITTEKRGKKSGEGLN